MKDGEKKAAGLLVGLLEEEPKPKPGKGAEAEEAGGDEETMKAARIDALRAFKAGLDAEDFEAADEAWDDYRAACEG